MHDNPNELSTRIRLGPSRKDDFQTVDFVGEGGLGYWPAFVPPDLADRLYARLHDDAPWQPGIDSGLPCQSVVVSGAAVRSPLGSALRQCPRARDAVAALMSLAELVFFPRSPESFGAAVLYHLTGGGNGFELEGSAGAAAVRTTPSAILTLGAARRVALRSRQSSKRMLFPIGRGSLLRIDDSAHRHWRFEIPQLPDPCEGHIGIALYRFA